MAQRAKRELQSCIKQIFGGKNGANWPYLREFVFEFAVVAGTCVSPVNSRVWKTNLLFSLSCSQNIWLSPLVGDHQQSFFCFHFCTVATLVIIHTHVQSDFTLTDSTIKTVTSRQTSGDTLRPPPQEAKFGELFFEKKGKFSTVSPKKNKRKKRLITSPSTLQNWPQNKALGHHHSDAQYSPVCNILTISFFTGTWENLRFLPCR